MTRPVLQLFQINPDGTTSQLTTEGPIKDVLSSEESYVLVSDELRKVFLWKGTRSSVRSKFIGAKRSQDIRGQVGMHFSVVPLDEGEEDNDFIQIIGGRTEGAVAQEIRQEATPAFKPSETSSPAPARQTRSIPSSPSSRASDNTGPLYTGQESMASYMMEDQQINFDQIMQKLEEIKIPTGYERELIVIGNQAYSVVEKVQNFLGEKKVEKVIERVGSIPEGIFFAENYSPRILSESGRIIAIEFLKRTGTGSQTNAPKEKSNVLRDQISQQLLGK